ncbi:hypothetical protein psal_cds_630 [Pandoravirus salinus]|uniref:Uncharacterized protein n=1 Tax=Pandoravirus salinus TaxID=1349410 RepID=S4VV93_9VIRU|nr:hypothetical protein psal_cds_630 [Pandoravirus salinus]AGO84519.1 hypothetical protein psal_cds_630 [Pandoravirus salinus]
MQTNQTPPRADDIERWVERTLACVAADGAIDADALDVVEFEHDLAVARTVVASARDLVLGTKYRGPSWQDVLVCGVRIPNEHKAGKPSSLVFIEAPPGSGTWRARLGWRLGAAEWDLPSGDLLPPHDDIIAALIALSVRSPGSPFGVVADCNDLGGKSRAWLWRMGFALAMRSTPWDLSAVDQEIGLARALINLMEARDDSQSACNAAPVRLDADTLNAADAAAYKAAIALWDQRGLAFRKEGTDSFRNRNGPLSDLRVFIAAGERMQATPDFYLAFVAPAIAARLQPRLDALEGTQRPAEVDAPRNIDGGAPEADGAQQVPADRA